MLHSSFWQRLAIAASLVLLMTTSLPLTMFSQTAFAQSSTVSITPTQGPAGTQVTGSGTNWTAGDQMQVSWADDGSILANTTVKSDGTFTVGFNIPSSAGQGGHNIYFTDLTSRYSLVAVFTVTTNTLTVTVQKVWTADGNNNAKTSFAPGDAIHYMVQIQNTNSTTVTATITFLATGPQQIYYWSGSASIPTGTPTFYSPSTIPTGAPAGKYTLTVTVSYNSASSSGKSQFTVATVVVQKVWTADGNNNARTSFLPGDVIHYMVQVKNFNSTTVTATFNFLATGPQKIFSWSGSGSVPPGTPSYYSPSTVPTNSPIGKYTLTVTVTYNSASSSGKSQFTVGSILKQPQYAGYGAYSGSSTSGIYSDIQADWQEPAAICPPSLAIHRATAFWVGLGGLNAPLEQIATLFSCTATGQVSYHAAYQMVPQGGGGSAHILGKEACRDGDTTCSTKVDATVKANDQIHAEVKYTGSNGLFKLYIHDITQKWYFSITTSANGSGTSAARSSAECVAEDPAWLFGLQPPLADFGTVFFTNCLADGKPIGNRGPYWCILQVRGKIRKGGTNPKKEKSE